MTYVMLLRGYVLSKTLVYILHVKYKVQFYVTTFQSLVATHYRILCGQSMWSLSFFFPSKYP